MDLKQQQENTRRVIEQNNTNNRNAKILETLIKSDYIHNYVKNALEAISVQEDTCKEYSLRSKKLLDMKDIFSDTPFNFTAKSNIITFRYYLNSIEFSFSAELMEKLHTNMSYTAKGIKFKDKPVSTSKDTETLLRKELGDLVYSILAAYKEED